MKQIDPDIRLNDLEQFLLDKGWIDWSSESVEKIEIPGDGNMNVVLRIITSQRSFILKQSRPYVQKYKDIPAPLNRIDVEYQFYKNIKDDKIGPHLPRVINYDPTNHLIMMEDIGQCKDMSTIYSARSIDPAQMNQLTDILSTIHEQDKTSDYPENKILRKLNHQHIFHLPFLNDNGFDLDKVQSGLQELSIRYKEHEELKRKVSSIGQQYLTSGTTLLHGDYYPGSWMNVDNKLYVLDPEFSFIGFAEFDVGVMIGHVLIATLDRSIIDHIISRYKGTIDHTLTKQIAGIEIIRRIIGLAQLQLNHSIKEKSELLILAEKLILH